MNGEPQWDIDPGGDERYGRLLLRMAKLLPAVLWTTDTDLVFTTVRGGALKTVGLLPDQLVNVSLRDYLHSEEGAASAVRAHQEALRGQSAKYEVQLRARHFDAYTEPLRDETGAIIGVIGIAYDVTDWRRVERERQLLRSQRRQQHKLEALGQLASGVAHEINNPIQSVMNFAQLIRARTTNAEFKDYADEIVNEAQRVASIVRNLQAFARQDEELASELQLAPLVDRTLSLFRSVLRKEQIEVLVDIPPDLPALWFRGQGLQQLIVNLLTGARDALNDRYPQAHADKKVWVRARMQTEQQARFVRLTLEDHGTTIAASDLPRVFDEFTSLPGRDQGTGFGLAVSRRIAEENGATLWVESVAKQYTRFHVDLPLATP